MAERIDTRDLVQELEDFESDREDGEQFDAEDVERANAIRELLETLGSEAEDGMTMIAEDDFEEYAQEFAEEIGAVEDFARWPATCIDWKDAARDLATDYTSVEFDGVSYYVR